MHAYTVRIKSIPLYEEDKREHPDVTSQHDVDAESRRQAEAAALEAAVVMAERGIKQTHRVVNVVDHGEKW